MIELIPGSFTWKMYQTYRDLGGDSDLPEFDSLWRFLRKITVWTVFRLIFSEKPRIPVIFCLILVVFAHFSPVYAAQLALLCGTILIYGAFAELFKSINFKRRPISLADSDRKVLIKLR